eukprot:TRINITY_DN2526_c0_g6_i1.p1 TRINITY_DN2526_c0_g6~~TRINITY_DN2526_c0_g6_i1.p1  ORF type:complete len:472 (-),score=89.21 TRINITY_DN2526_c0_g6_i1:36-1451(-)
MLDLVVTTVSDVVALGPEYLSVRLIVEGVMALFILFLIFQRRYKIRDEKKETLSYEEIEQLISEWEPEPLVKTKDIPNNNSVRKLPPIQGPCNKRLISVGSKTMLNMSSFGFLGLQTNPEVIDAALETMNKYGVGSCGPRGFLGNLEPHFTLEARMAKFLGTEEALMFSAGFATIASVIPAFCKAQDILIIDKGCFLGVQIGAKLSRSDIKWFNHNDISDLKRILESLSEEFKAMQKRIWVLIEGIYYNYGTIAPLDEIIKLKEVFPFRLIIEESFSLGVLGKQGKGITEHFGIDVREIEIITSSLGNSIGATGGACFASYELVRHMRLNCTGYVYSCSLPPYISSAAHKAFDLLENSDFTSSLRERIKSFRSALDNAKINKLQISGDSNSPLLHLRLKKSSGTREGDSRIIKTLSEKLAAKNILLIEATYVDQERFLPQPSLKLCINVLHESDDIVKLVNALEEISEDLE